MAIRRTTVGITGLVGALLALGCGVVPVDGQTVVCKREWTCDGTVVSDNAESFCTDPRDTIRQERIDAYMAEFAETCDGVTVRCVDTTNASCAATCTFAAACNVEDAEFIRL